jgi:natural product biosynthesis luciferase-like monooxygenase protein
MTGAVPTLSVFFFTGADTGADTGPGGRYDGVLSTAELADELGYEAVWIPERHFHPFGGLYPNPAVLGAALAARTRRIGIRAGSVVVPLHHPARIAEDWAMVDALSGGRAGVSVATGWNPADFALARCEFADRRKYTAEAVDTLRALWRGDTMASDTGAVRTYPVAARGGPPMWLTAMSGPETFIAAGEGGFNVLTAFLQQDPRQLAGNIARYRRAFAGSGAGSGGTPHVTLMVHTHVADSLSRAVAEVSGPLVTYQGSFLDLADRGGTPLADEEPLTDEEKETLARYAAGKYATERGLVGGPAEIAARLRGFADLGVDEVACLVDFGMAPHQVRDTVTRLAGIRRALRDADT